MNSHILRALVIAGLAAFPVAALADSPGAGGERKSDMQSGAEVYRHVCQACHMADGKGGKGAAVIPALAGNPKLAISAYPAGVVLNGFGAMPWFNGTLSPEQIANVINYVRTHFGNSYADTLSADDVKAMAGPVPHVTH
ncbi:cytochrome c precursor [Gluconacetobacter johannae DSM 13595]|uniref:Cytochrome c n=1 Tax=Gluconacetobacter johannae TaxID=112140 RepID=A0A7W4J9K4_9PROT|nr:cytochrome c [Gluconacetobacter johannae]MBB2177202.1 cytochrome c [Gluconacetobacter johannae]GBQ82092.1 cytochrome c precursor [Gluconacetobacter johannae DSM 13595]